METSFNQLRTRILLRLSLVLLVIALLIPAVRSSLLQQARMLIGTPTGVAWTLRQAGVRQNLPDSDPTDEESALASVMRMYRLDYQIQSAYALRADYQQKPNQEDERVKRLRLLLPAFPNIPALYAHILRIETARDVQIRRDTEYETYMNGRASQYTATEDVQPATPEALSEYDHDATEGERLDPRNGFFPMMRAVGLFAARRDDEAAAAVIEAANKPTWNDYTTDEADSVWRLAARAFGNRSAAVREVLLASTPLPHLSALRMVARMTAFTAAHLEKAGRLDAGIRLRLAGIDAGAMVRTFSPTTLGGYYGAEMSEYQWLRPGGANPQALPGDMPPEQKNAIRREAFLTFLRESGHTADAAHAQAEFDAAKRGRAILDRSTEPQFASAPRQAKALTAWWMAGNVLLASAVELFLLSTVALALARRRKRLAAAVGERRDSPLIPLVVVATLTMVFLAVAFQTQWGGGFGAMRGVLHTLSYTGGDPDSPARFLEPPGTFSTAPAMQIVAVLLTVAAPAALLSFLVAFSIRREQDLESTILHGLPEIGAQLAVALLCAYLVCNLLTLRQESRVEQVVEHGIRSGNQAVAEMEGATWPPR